MSILLLGYCGCGSGAGGNIGTVEGTVTLDGNPVEEATVRFYPTSGERGASGKTDRNGHFELRYTRDTMGAIIGDHKVTVSTKVVADNYSDDGAEAKKETIPRKYVDRKKTDLTATVKQGSNTCDFDLKSKKK